MVVLVFAPHNDDEVLGCGGCIAKHAKNGDIVVVCEVTAGDLSDDLVQLQKKEALNSHIVLGVSKTIFMDLPVVGLRETKTIDINARFLSVVKEINPDIIYIPFKGDMHIDHRVVADSVMVAARPINSKKIKAIFAYETLSETEWNVPTVDNIFIPNVYCDISETMELKIEAMKCHKSQLREFPHPRSLKAIEALAMHRGGTICVEYAEAFMCLRSIF